MWRVINYYSTRQPERPAIVMIVPTYLVTREHQPEYSCLVNSTKCDHECAGRPFNHTLGPPNFHTEREAQLTSLANYYGAPPCLCLRSHWTLRRHRTHLPCCFLPCALCRLHALFSPELPLLGAAQPGARARAHVGLHVAGGPARRLAAPGATGQEALCT